MSQEDQEKMIPEAPPEFQLMFDNILNMLALRSGFENSAAWIQDEEECGGVVYHFTLNFMGAHTFFHNDEFIADGPGSTIHNLALQQSGLLTFLFGREMSCVLQQPGDCISFSNKARTEWQHGVFRGGSVAKLPLLEGCHADMRIVATIRVKDLTEVEQKEWYNENADAYGIANPFDNLKPNPTASPASSVKPNPAASPPGATASAPIVPVQSSSSSSSSSSSPRPGGLIGPQRVPSDVFSGLVDVAGVSWKSAAGSGIFWHIDAKKKEWQGWMPRTKELRTLANTVRAAVNKAMKDKLLVDLSSVNSESNDLYANELCSLRLMHNVPGDVFEAHVEDEGTCPSMLILVVLEGQYQLHLHQSDQPSNVYAVMVQTGDVTVLTGPALKVWKHIAVLTEEKGRSVMSLGFRAAVTIKKEPKEHEAKTKKVAAAHKSTTNKSASVAAAAAHTQAAYSAVTAVYKVRKALTATMRTLCRKIWYGKRGEIWEAKAKAGPCVGTLLTMFCGRYLGRFEIIRRKDFFCVRECFDWLSHTAFVPFSVSIEHSVCFYYTFFNPEAVQNLADAIAWDARNAATRDRVFYAWEDRLLDHYIVYNDGLATWTHANEKARIQVIDEQLQTGSLTKDVLATSSPQEKEAMTQKKMVDLVASLTRFEKAEQDSKFWGPNWETTKRFEKNTLRKAMHAFTPWQLKSFGGSVMHVTINDKFPGDAKMHNVQSVVGSVEVSSMSSVAIKAYEQEVRQPDKEKQHLQAWAVGVQHAHYGQKLIFKVQLRGSTTAKRVNKRSTSIPTRKDPATPSNDVQRLFEFHLDQCAFAEGLTADEFIAKHDGVMYDYTINYMTGHSLAHNDQPAEDGPGAFISNFCLQGEGMLYFVDKKPRVADKKQFPMTGVWQTPGDLISFSGECRLLMSHGVLLQLPEQVRKLPLTEPAMKRNKTWAEGVRIIATLRCGKFNETTKWNAQWLTEKTKEEKAQEDAEDTPPEEGDVEVEEVADPKPPKRSRTGGITPGRHTSVKAAPKAVKPEVAKLGLQNALVPASLAWMPRKGDKFIKTSSPWKEAEVTAIFHNFAAFDNLDRNVSGKKAEWLSFRPGCAFQMKFKSKTVGKELRTTKFYVWTVGMLYSKKSSSSKPVRAVVLQRQVGSKPVGPLETWNAFHLSTAPAFFNMLVSGKRLNKKDFPDEWDDYMYRSHIAPNVRASKMLRLVQWRDKANKQQEEQDEEDGEEENDSSEDDVQEAEARSQPARKKRKTQSALPEPNVAASVPGPNVAAQRQGGQANPVEDRYLKHIENQLKATEDASKAAVADAKKALEAEATEKKKAIDDLIKTMAEQNANERTEKINAQKMAHEAQQLQSQQQANASYYALNLQASTNSMHQQQHFMLQLQSSPMRNNAQVTMDKAWESYGAMPPVQPPYHTLQPRTGLPAPQAAAPPAHQYLTLPAPAAAPPAQPYLTLPAPAAAPPGLLPSAVYCGHCGAFLATKFCRQCGGAN